MQAAPRSHPATYGNPCGLTFLDGCKRCLLSDPLRNEDFVIETPSVPKGAVMTCSNNGWLLMAEAFDPRASTMNCHLFFFNPLTQATIQLPKLGLPPLLSYPFSFSSQPTSSDCVAVGMQSVSNPYFTVFDRWVSGDKEWKTLHIDHQENFFLPSLYMPFYSKDRVYHLDMEGRLGIYNLSDLKLTLIGEMLGPMVIDLYDFGYYNLLEMDDELVLVRLKMGDECIHLYEFDDSKKQWIELETIGGRTMFCSVINCMFMKAIPSGQGGGEGGGGGRVYVSDVFHREIMMSDPVKKFECFIMKHHVHDYWIQTCWIDLKS